MFTGIIQAVGRIARLEPRGGDVRLVVDAAALDMADVALGDSISKLFGALFKASPGLATVW